MARRWRCPRRWRTRRGRRAADGVGACRCVSPSDRRILLAAHPQPPHSERTGCGCTLRCVTAVSTPTSQPAEARLLVVDDEPNIVELLSASLRYAGFEVATATTG